MLKIGLCSTDMESVPSSQPAPLEPSSSRLAQELSTLLHAERAKTQRLKNQNAALAANLAQKDAEQARRAEAAASSQTSTTTFRFDQCSVTVGRNKGPILSNVSGHVAAGSVFAIMGPSGAGKTTIVEVLTRTPVKGGTAKGYLTLNGRHFDDEQFREHAAFVPQEDRLQPSLTCKDSLLKAADFYQSSAQDVDDLLEKLGLTECADTAVGGGALGKKGLSGGQKRRLSLAIALIKRPSVIFLDEPTSGLDSAAADAIMELLYEWAKENECIVICNIHQPSTRVFNNFITKVMLLARGWLPLCKC